jgi:hypothetical protein
MLNLVTYKVITGPYRAEQLPAVHTLKKLIVEPLFFAPYLMISWLASSLTFLNGVAVVSMVRKAAKLAVYDETIMRVKNHQILATMRVDIALQFDTISSTNETHLILS